MEGYIQALIDNYEINISEKTPIHIKRDIEVRVNQLKGILAFYNKKCNKNINLKNILTCELVEELKTREGIKVHEVFPYEQEYMILCKAKDGRRFGEDGIHCSEVLSSNNGGAIILEVID